MAFLGISLKSAKMGTGRAILGHLNEKRQDKLLKDQRENKLADLTEELKLKDQYAVKADDRQWDKTKQRNTIQNEAWAQQALDMSSRTGQTYVHAGNGNFSRVNKEEKKESFDEISRQAEKFTNAYRKNGILTGSQAYIVSNGKLVLAGKPSKEESSDNKVMLGSLLGAGQNGGPPKFNKVYSSEYASNEVNSANSLTFPQSGGGQAIMVLADQARLSTKEVPYHNASHGMTTLLESDVGFHIERHKKSKSGGGVEGGDLFGFVRQTFINSAPSILDGLKTVTTTQDGITRIANPMLRFNLADYAAQGVEQAAHAKYIVREIIAPTLSMQKELLLEALNLPVDSPGVNVEENNGNFDLIFDSSLAYRLEAYSTTETDETTGKTRKVMDPRLSTLAQEIANVTGQSQTDILSAAISQPGDPLDHMQMLQDQSKNWFAEKVVGKSLDSITFNAVEKEKIQSIVLNSENAQAGIASIRSMIPAKPPRKITEIELSPGQVAKPIWNRTVQDSVGFTIEGARQRADNALKARNNILTLMHLMGDLGAKADPIAQLRLKLAGGVEAIDSVLSLTSDFEAFLESAEIGGSTPEEVERNKELRREQFKQLSAVRDNVNAHKNSGAELNLDGLAIMLTNQLGYFMAGAVQGGGSTGRNISDFDVQNNMKAIQLGNFAPTAVKLANLQFLLDEMDQTYAVYDAYASSKNDYAMFQAANIYDKTMGATNSSLSKLIGRIGDKGPILSETERQNVEARTGAMRRVDSQNRPSLFGPEGT